jgi:hypothetical protein
MLRAFPMILVAVLAYNLLVFGGMAAGHDVTALLAQAVNIKVVSGDLWKITASDGFVALALLLLFIETVKATRTEHREIFNHGLSLLTFIGALVEFIVLKGFGTSSFFFLTMMCLFDVVAGYTISIMAAKRDLTMAPHDRHDSLVPVVVVDVVAPGRCYCCTWDREGCGRGNDDGVRRVCGRLCVLC